MPMKYQNIMNSKQKKCGLFLSKFYSFIAASTDQTVTCNCHGESLMEIKCPYSFQDKFNSEYVNDCDFLWAKNWSVHLIETQKNYTQVISQMAVTDIKECYFVVWKTKDVFVCSGKIFP